MRIAASISKFSALTIATGLYSGFFPIAPGTAGTVVGVGVAWLLRSSPLNVWITVLAILFVVGVWASHRAGQIFGIVDASHIVVDEIIGFLVTMIGIPITGYWLFWGFIFFRILDVIKFPPANIFDEKVKNGFGVVMDDVAAGVYGNILLHLMWRASI